MRNKVFLGGTCANSTWRDELIPTLTVDYFNPIVDDWTSECQVEEERQKNVECNIHLYVITKEMIGAYSIAEAVCSAHIKGKTTIFHVIPDGFGDHEIKSFRAIVKMIQKLGGVAYMSSGLQMTTNFINACFT